MKAVISQRIMAVRFSADHRRGFQDKPAPFGIGFTGTACSEPRLIELAYAFEQATKRRACRHHRLPECVFVR